MGNCGSRAIPDGPNMPKELLPDFRPFKTSSDDAVYCMDGYAKRWYPSATVYGSYFPGPDWSLPDWSQITVVNKDVMTAIPDGIESLTHFICVR